MLLHYRIFFIIFSILCNTSYPVLVVAEKLAVDNFEGQPKTFYLYADDHTSDPGVTQDQIVALHNSFMRREKKEKDVLHLLVEKPAHLARDFYDSPMMLMDIIPALTENTRLTKTIVEDVEIRAIGNAACAVLKPSLDPFSIPNPCYSNAADRWCTINHITFQDLFAEYDQYKQKMLVCHENTSFLLHDVIAKKLLDLDEEYKALLKMLANKRISSKEEIWDLSCRLFKSGSKTLREQLYSDILDLFLHLFDLSCLRRMIELKKRPKIGLIAGFWHIHAISAMLLGTRARMLVSHGVFPIIQSLYKPLKAKHLDLFVRSNSGNCLIM